MTPPGLGRRTAARIAAVQALYGMELAGGDAGSTIADVLARAATADAKGTPALPAPDAAHLARVVEGVAEHRARLDSAIADVLAADLSLARIEVLLAAILRAGAFELMDLPEIPFKVVISEYVDVAHAFFAGKEPMLVNGVLDRLARRERPAERAPDPADAVAQP
jgi:N utilization substance protein B